MIYTVTFSPSLDYIIRVRDFRPDSLNRTVYEQILAGGKGINVSLVLKNLGHVSTALGFTAGFTGREIETRLAAAGCRTDFIHIEQGFSRINVKMTSLPSVTAGSDPGRPDPGGDRSCQKGSCASPAGTLESGPETEINGMGPDILPEHLEALYRRLDKMDPGDVLVISGSVPPTLPSDIYEQVLKRVSGRGVRTIADASGDLLRRVLPYRPWLVKPNIHELGGLFGVSLSSWEQALPYARRLLKEGARNVCVSMGGQGALFLGRDGKGLRCSAPSGIVVNSIGAGDSLVAGFLAAYLETGDFETAFRLGTACGSASAFTDHLATRSEAEALLAEIRPVPVPPGS